MLSGGRQACGSPLAAVATDGRRLCGGAPRDLRLHVRCTTLPPRRTRPGVIGALNQWEARSGLASGLGRCWPGGWRRSAHARLCCRQVMEREDGRHTAPARPRAPAGANRTAGRGGRRPDGATRCGNRRPAAPLRQRVTRLPDPPSPPARADRMPADRARPVRWNRAEGVPCCCSARDHGGGQRATRTPGDDGSYGRTPCSLARGLLGKGGLDGIHVLPAAEPDHAARPAR
jgi:hypothetical protein